LFQWAEIEPTIVDRQEYSRVGGGQAQAKNLGDPYWVVNFRSMPLDKSAAKHLEGRLQSLGGMTRTFYADLLSYPRPKGTTGAISGVTVKSVHATRRGLALQGLTAGRIIPAGTYLSVTNAGGGYDLHLTAEAATANGSGDTISVEVAPVVGLNVAAGNAVRLTPPRIELFMEPGTLSVSRRSGLLYDVAFNAVQVIR
jgi:hypothetical protein